MANYLTAAQDAELDRLMSVPTNTWPPELIAYVRSQRGPFCGEALIDAVTSWLRSQP